MWRALFDQYPRGHCLLIFANILGDVKGKGSKQGIIWSKFRHAGDGENIHENPQSEIMPLDNWI